LLVQRLGTVVYYTLARLASPGEVQCSFPVSPLDPTATQPSYIYYVSVSNDNVTFSSAVMVIAFDSKCQICSLDSAVCTLKV